MSIFSLADCMARSSGRSGVGGVAPPPSPAGGRSRWILQRGADTSSWPRGDFFIATDSGSGFTTHAGTPRMSRENRSSLAPTDWHVTPSLRDCQSPMVRRETRERRVPGRTRPEVAPGTLKLKRVHEWVNQVQGASPDRIPFQGRFGAPSHETTPLGYLKTAQEESCFPMSTRRLPGRGFSVQRLRVRRSG